MKKIYLLVSFLLLLTTLNSESINISQVDSSSLLLNQNIDLYLQITDKNGDPVPNLSKDNFYISESTRDMDFSRDLPIVGFKEGINKINGINFLLLVDNSGSMYRTIEGEETSDDTIQRITIAKQAIRDFVGKSIDVKDTISLASFNSFYTFHSKDIRDEGLSVLNSIYEPAEGFNKTELYLSLVDSIQGFSGLKGRKVVIVLSDGANVPNNESFIYEYTDTIEEFQKEGISIFAINFAGQADKNLVKITSQTGGNIFEASNASELVNVYDSIKEQILKEYLVTYKATMEPGNIRHVKVQYKDSKPLTRIYFSSTVFGTPKDRLSLLFILFPIISIFIMVCIWLIKFENVNKLANLEVLQAAPGVTISDQTIALSKSKTVIGGSNNADLTISSDTSNEDDLATIVYDEKTEHFKVVSSQTVIVNNQITKDKELEAGDVINIGGTTIVFDDDDFTKKK